MRNNGFTMVLFYFSLVVFISALSISAYLFYFTTTAIDESYETAKNTDKNQRMVLRITEPYEISGAHVLQTINLIADIGCNIVVDGVSFMPSLDINQTDVSVVKMKGKYLPNYKRDSTGALMEVTFTSK
ncbi:hypothetical protein YDYSY3_39510 [Paenibacillus chitinolyticus]|uniref:hypothetical protein n=1 Tax=Paenibacillus chitinolyticus TaxID=79263 RepID=UPI0026E4D265|nr:hypothetical protein [Paenibacillus chitinolyticus]GKS12951.1 hypothetical protein YDYSY3_39510 [Paenibacillus chitinolyticus]